MKTRILSTAIIAGLAGLSALPAHAAFTLPSSGFVQYGDAQSYSLPLLAYLYDQSYGGGTGPGNPFYVNSTPGAIQDLIVVATGSSGGPVNTNFNGMDDAYPTPSGVSGSNFFSTGTTPDPGSGPNTPPSPDPADTWDMNIASLKTFLGGEDMIFFFNNNQLNKDGEAAQSLAAWALITVRDTSGAIKGQFEFVNKYKNDNPGGSYKPITEGGGGRFNGDVADFISDGSGPNAGTNLSTDYVLSGGALCLTNAGALKACDGSTLLPDIDPGSAVVPEVIVEQFDHNLGANQAAYAILFPELNTLLDGMSDGLVSIDLRLGCDPASSNGGGSYDVCTGKDWGYGRNINNGYEQLFIGKASTVINMPEPGTLALLGLGLVGAALSWRRRV